MVDIVCYMGGACGDLVTAVIDSTGVKLDDNRFWLDDNRMRLKKPHLFATDLEKDQYLATVNEQSISSHDYEYHARRKHDIICVGVFDMTTAMWAATRFKELHRPTVWAEMTALCGAETLEDYAEMYIHNTNMMTRDQQPKIINLADIIGGRLIPVLEQYTTRRLDVDLYTEWKRKNVI